MFGTVVMPPVSPGFTLFSHQAMVAFEIKASFDLAEIRGSDVVVTQGSNMDAICTVCSQRYGSHSGLACAGSSGPPPPLQHFLFKGSAQAVSDPEWYAGKVIAHLGGSFVSVKTTKGTLAVPIKDQSPSSQCFMFAVKAAVPTAAAPQPAAVLTVESLDEAVVRPFVGPWVELQFPSLKASLRLPSVLLPPDLASKSTRLPHDSSPPSVEAAPSTVTQLQRLLEVVGRCSLPFQANDLFFIQAVVDFVSQPS
jgi:hypothetical protein